MNSDTTELLRELERRGVRLEVDEAGQLRYRAPRGALTAELRDSLVARKTELLCALQGSEREAGGHFDGPILAVLVRSPTLDSPVWLLEPGGLDAVPALGRLPWFLLAEVPTLERWRADRVRKTAEERCGGSAALH